MSHHAGCTTASVNVHWVVPEVDAPMVKEGRISLLLIPWPATLPDRFLRPSGGPTSELDETQFGFFKFDPAYAFEVSYFANLVEEARSHVDGLLGVVLPEGALTQPEAEQLEVSLQHAGVDLLVTGVRGDRTNSARLRFMRSQTHHVQPKHHRWKLDGRQIEQYKQAWSLSPTRWWWEDIELGDRRLYFVCSAAWLTISHLICEDLARLDPIGDVIRTVGPQLIIAILTDGPQLERRWPGRYASVLSDDPGSSVLTLSSLGMVKRSAAPDDPAREEDGAPEGSRSVALWKDPITGTKELTLPEDADALLITLCAEYGTEWTADGRTDGGAKARLRLVGNRALKSR